jgi:myosin heavy subunit
LFHHVPYLFANIARGIVPAMLMRMQASREQQLDEMDIDISRRMRSVILSSLLPAIYCITACISLQRFFSSQLKFRESEITRGMNELALKRKNFDSDCLAERTSIEVERERLKVDMAALLAEMSIEKRRQELLRLEQEHRQNIMKDFEESNRLQEVREELAQKEVDFMKHVEEASAQHTIEIRARMDQMEVEVQERMQEFAKQMEAKVLELAAREKVLEGQERPIMLAKEMEDIIATCEAKVRRNDKETARLKAWEIKLQYQSKELDLLSDTVTQQLGNDEMKKIYLGMQAQYKEKLSRLALAEKKGKAPVHRVLFSYVI